MLLCTTLSLSVILTPKSIRRMHLLTYNSSTNRNGHKLLDFVDEFQLVITNTRFMKLESKLWTHQYPTGARSQLYIRNKWKNSIRNAQAYSSFTNVGSDHRIFSCYINLSLRASKMLVKHPMKQIDWQLVASNPELAFNYAIEVHNRFEILWMSGAEHDSAPRRKRGGKKGMFIHFLIINTMNTTWVEGLVFFWSYSQ